MSTCKRTQGFGDNANPLYAGAGQKGHTGVDDTCGYGSKVYSLKKGFVYKILDREHPAKDGSGYWGVFMISEENGQYFEWQIGHLSKIYCRVGDVVNPWDFIGEEGNRGGVYAGSVLITPAMQEAGDKRGSHRHYNKKLLTRVHESQFENKTGQWLTAYSETVALYKDSENYLYSVNDFRNGYNGSVDCAKDIEEGRKNVEAHFATPPQHTPEVLEILKKNLKQQILDLMYELLKKIGMVIPTMGR